MSRRKNAGNKWTPAEDALLREGVASFMSLRKPVSFEQIAGRIPGRSVKQVKERWENSLDPNLRKGDWSVSEQAQLYALMSRKGQNWTQIQKEMRSRSMHCIKSKGRKLLGETLSKRLLSASQSTTRGKSWSDTQDAALIDLHQKYLQKFHPGFFAPRFSEALEDLRQGTDDAPNVNSIRNLMQNFESGAALDIFGSTKKENFGSAETQKCLVEVKSFEASSALQNMLDWLCGEIDCARPIAQIDRRLLETCNCSLCSLRRHMLSELDVDLRKAWTQSRSSQLLEKLLQDSQVNQSYEVDQAAEVVSNGVRRSHRPKKPIKRDSSELESDCDNEAIDIPKRARTLEIPYQASNNHYLGDSAGALSGSVATTGSFAGVGQGRNSLIHMPSGMQGIDVNNFFRYSESNAFQSSTAGRRLSFLFGTDDSSNLDSANYHNGFSAARRLSIFSDHNGSSFPLNWQLKSPPVPAKQKGDSVPVNHDSLESSRVENN